MEERRLKAIICDGLVIVLTAVLFILPDKYRAFPEINIVSAGLFMVLLSASSVIDPHGKSKLFICLQVLLLITAAAFGLTGGYPAAFAVFVFAYDLKYPIRLVLTAAAAAVMTFAAMGNDPALTIIYTAIALAAALLMYIPELIIRKIIDYKKGVDQSLAVSALNEMKAKELNRELAINAAVAERNARLTEREEISRNIHNSVGHSITAAIMTLDAADMLYDKDPEAAKEKMNAANERMRGSLESIRRAVRVLDSGSEAVSSADLKGSIDTLCENFVMDTTMQVERDMDLLPDAVMLPHDLFEFLTGAVLELLSNGVRHGKADSFFISLSGDSANIELTVSDNGNSDWNETVAAARLEQGFGLKKIVSYVKRSGGKVRIDNESGFRVKISMPVRTAEGEND